MSHELPWRHVKESKCYLTWVTQSIFQYGKDTLVSSTEFGSRRHVREAFCAFDGDGDGLLSEDELRRAVSSLAGKGVPTRVILEMIEVADDDEVEDHLSGVIDSPQFSKCGYKVA